MIHRRVGYLAIALLIVYGVVLPNAVTNRVAAHRLPWTLVANGHLRYFNKMSPSLPGGNFSSRVYLAEAEWQPLVSISIDEVSNNNDADVSLVSVCAPDNNLLGVTALPKKQGQPGSIRFNRCVLVHKCPNKNKCPVRNDNGKVTNTKLYSTTPSRRTRTFVHEFGHALGLDHNGLVHWDSVMSTIIRYRGTNHQNPIQLSNSATTTYDLQPHDTQDIEGRWP